MRKITRKGIKKPKFFTFKEWSEAGFTINKGSKATWINGVPKFSDMQVSKRFKKTADIYEDFVSDDFDTWGMDAMEWGDN